MGEGCMWDEGGVYGGYMGDAGGMQGVTLSVSVVGPSLPSHPALWLERGMQLREAVEKRKL